MSALLKKSTAVIAASLLAVAAQTARADSFSENFEGTALADTGWVTVNRSTTPNSAGVWRLGTAIIDADSNPVVLPYEGSQFAVVSWNSSNSTSTSATLSNWMLSPLITGLNNGDTFSFFTSTTPASAYPDRLELRLSTSGSSVDVGTTTTSVGAFSTVLLTINPTLAVGGYPETWTQYTATVSGLSGPVDGRVAFRYFVTSGGPNGANSNIIGVDQFSYTSVSAVPEPGTWALMAGGLLGVVALRRRRSE
ncbi:MAG: PEP-CTERM sorting domain-containing protein [Roseateles sp.]|nr:MAG: PEP-CTERM sorting domain-containing protein [Roseateles sp.]